MYPKYIFSLERAAALALRSQPLQLATKSNHPLANFFCHVDNFGTGPSIKKMYPKYIFSEGASWRGGAQSVDNYTVE